MSDRAAIHTEGRVLRLGISGFGRLAQNYYVPALARLGGVQIAAIADPADACRVNANKLLPTAATYISQAAMLDAASLDGLLVASPPSAHLPAWADAAARPTLAVFMEKPFVLNDQLSAAKQMPAAESRLMVNFNRRFWPPYQRIGNLVRSGALGNLRSLELELSVDVSKWLSVTQHRLQPGEGGALYDLGSQLIDLASVIVGKTPTAVSAIAQTHQWAEDHVEITLYFATAAYTEVRCFLAYGNKTRERIHAVGDVAKARIDDPNMALHLLPLGKTSKVGDLVRRSQDFATLARHAAFRHTSMSRQTIELALAAFVHSIRTGNPFTPGFAEAQTNAMLLEAASRSLKSGEIESLASSPLEIAV